MRKNAIIIIIKKIKNTPLAHYALRAYREERAAKRNFIYPKSLRGSQGVPMPSFMPMRPKLWSGEGFINDTYIHINSVDPLIYPLDTRLKSRKEVIGEISGFVYSVFSN